MDENGSTDLGGAVRVTLKDVYTDLLIMKVMLQNLQSQLPGHIENTEKEIAEVNKDLSDHERRLRMIETKMWAAVGVFGLIAAASPYISKLLLT